MIPRLRKRSLIAVLCVVILLGAIPVASGKDNKLLFGLKSTYTYENKGNKPYIILDEDAEIPLFLQNKWQKASILTSSHELIREITDEDGNPIGILDLPIEIPAGERLVFTVEYLIESQGMVRPDIDPNNSGKIKDIPENLIEIYTTKTDTFRRNEEIETIAEEISEGTNNVLEVVVEVLRWIVNEVEYQNFEVPLYPNETLCDLQGDCDDQAILMISMLRSLKIPAFLQIGIVFSESINSETSSWEGHLSFIHEGVGWHGWAMVYIPPWGWLPIDLTLVNRQDPLDMIKDAPEYSSNIITSFNVSNQNYIEGSRISRKRLISSDIYITITDEAIDQSNKRNWNLYALIPAVIFGVAITASVYFFLSRKVR